MTSRTASQATANTPAAAGRLLVVDDHQQARESIAFALRQSGYAVECTSSAVEGLERLDRAAFDVVVSDLKMPGMTGLEFLAELRRRRSTVQVIMVTAYATVATAVEAMRHGAFDFLEKPFNVEELEDLVGRALRRGRPTGTAADAATISNDAAPAMIGSSPQMEALRLRIARAAPTEETVLICGESGTGKELVARAIYQHSDRAECPFIAVNCAALPDNLLESELFGHEKGSFTGAEKRRIGKFEQCHGGTIFLDEIGDMSPTVQAKVLRVLQDQRFERVGGNESITTDVRVVTATNRPLEEMVKNGEFRDDLLYRLNGVTIHLAPLRERTQDLTNLIQYYLSRATRELNKLDIQGLSPDALAVLMAYSWPGNVRELQAVIRQAVLNTTGTVIVEDFLPAEVRPVSRLEESPSEEPRPSAPSTPPPEEPRPTPRGAASDLAEFVQSRLNAGTVDLYAETLGVMERFLITRVLQETGGNQSKAAEILGITRGKIRDRIATFGISVDKSVSVDQA